jgi:hypothetical protein
MNWIYITSEPALAAVADRAGVAQVMVDLESIGKAERQAGYDGHQAHHTVADIGPVARAVTRAETMVRVNPLGGHTADEVSHALEAGATRLMLPMFDSRAEVADFFDIVARRVPVTLLVETPESLTDLEAYIPMLRQRDTIHFGLNDLTLGLHLGFVFEPLAWGFLEQPCRICREAGVPFGIGGVSRAGSGELPAELILGEHVRLGSTAAILSRAFRKQQGDDLSASLAELTQVIDGFRRQGEAELEHNRDKLIDRVRSLAAARRH